MEYCSIDNSTATKKKQFSCVCIAGKIGDTVNIYCTGWATVVLLCHFITAKAISARHVITVNINLPVAMRYLKPVESSKIIFCALSLGTIADLIVFMHVVCESIHRVFFFKNIASKNFELMICVKYV